MTAADMVLTACDREPIHIPGSIQPHGILLVIDRETGRIRHGAGDIEGRLGVTDWQGQPLERVLGAETAQAILAPDAFLPRHITPPASQQVFDISRVQGAPDLLIELEPAAPIDTLHHLLPQLERAAHGFEQAPDMAELMDLAAREFRRLTGFDRVMVYQFVDDEAGKVVAESTASGDDGFLNHYFPASDIPVQARMLYLRNLVRVIPDAHYVAAPLRPPYPSDAPLDMSGCSLRSVSPVHLKYLRNMGVAASASFSIVKDDRLWGLIACHNAVPRRIALDTRSGCRALVAALSRQIKARSDTKMYRERMRLRMMEDRIGALLLRDGSLDQALAHHLDEVQQMLGADGIAIRRGPEIVSAGKAPTLAQITAFSDWLVRDKAQRIFATSELSATDAPKAAHSPLAAGLLAMTLSAAEPWVVMWFRAEVVETINWAGNPHKAVQDDGHGTLSPRASFQSWSETVSAKARRWTIPEMESADRLAGAIQTIWQTRRIQTLNTELLQLVREKDGLLTQREFLLGEVNHRVQNSLTLVSAFLSMQARKSPDASVRNALEEARHRISAVSLVHRRLYGTDQLRMVDAARYIDELLEDILATLDEEWRSQIQRDLHPVFISNDRAISMGLVLTELIINANKYAYGGRPGPLTVTLTTDGEAFQLTVADQGKGRANAVQGFGSQMINALMLQLDGTLRYLANDPGTRAVLSAPNLRGTADH